MTTVPPSTLFSEAPDWGWLIVLYFFFGGLAGGSYFLGALIEFFGRSEDRPLARLGYYIAFPSIVVSGVLLILDLGRPERFWHMLVASNTYRPIFKYWSPISVGAWALLIFSAFSLWSFLGALADDGRFSWRGARRGRRPSVPGRVTLAIGTLLGLYVAGYTGVLLAVTNRPIWSDTPLLGMLFVVSAGSISAAFMLLLAHRRRWTLAGLADLHRMDAWMIFLELIVLICVMASLGRIIRAWLNIWGILLVGVVVLGMIVPLALYWRRREGRHAEVMAAAALVLVAGFVLRMVIVFSGQGSLGSLMWAWR